MGLDPRVLSGDFLLKYVMASITICDRYRVEVKGQLCSLVILTKPALKPCEKDLQNVTLSTLALPIRQPTLRLAKILSAHDVGDVIYGCDTGMFDELKVLPLFRWTSECIFQTYLKRRTSRAVDVMYEE